MRYCDQHIHSAASFDATASMGEMARAARDHGMAAVCFTDHVDLDDSRTGRLSPEWRREVPRCRAAWEELSAGPPAVIPVRFGMELGGPNHDPDTAARLAADPALDFVLGSLHNLRNETDFYWLRYSPSTPVRELNRRYLRELLELAALDCFDVMAHIGYTARYMHRDGREDGDVTPDRYGDELEALFTRLIQRGRGLEVNVSGLRHGHTTYPNAQCLRLYRQLGGEIVTVGSDAHTLEEAGVGVADGYALLRDLGFRYVAEFRTRRPEFFPL